MRRRGGDMSFVNFSATTWGFQCERCGGRHEMPKPIALTLLVRLGKAFEVLHRECKPKETGK